MGGGGGGCGEGERGREGGRERGGRGRERECECVWGLGGWGDIPSSLDLPSTSSETTRRFAPDLIPYG